MQKLYQKTYKKIFIVKKVGLIFAIFGIGVVLISIVYFSGRIDIWSYDKDLEQRIPFTKEELIICGKYDKNVVSFETNYGTKLNYIFPENTELKDIAKFTK